MSHPTWTDIFEDPFVALVIGARGSGKTATCHRLLEVYGDEVQKRDAYIMGFPESEVHHLPDWIDILPDHTPMDQWPENSVVLVHEAHHLIHARRSMDVENLEIDRLVTVSRQKDSVILFDTQQARRLDVNQVAAVDGIIVKWPALLQEEFERRQIQSLISEAKDALSRWVHQDDTDDYTYVTHEDELVEHAYVYANHFRGLYPHPIALAEHWSDRISRVYGEVDAEEVEGATGEAGDDGLDREHVAILEVAAEWAREHRPYEYSVQGFAYDDLDVGGEIADLGAISRVPNILHRLSQLGYVKKQYSSSNKANRYRLTDQGWTEIDVPPADRPDEGET